jgi:hypothetical protein
MGFTFLAIVMDGDGKQTKSEGTAVNCNAEISRPTSASPVSKEIDSSCKSFFSAFLHDPPERYCAISSSLISLCSFRGLLLHQINKGV